MTELWQLSATELAKRVRQRDVSAREVADAVLDRLDAVNPAINAVVEHRPDDVRRQADEVDRAIARGDDPGPLAGVPVTVKINVDQAGFATTNGTRLQENLIAHADSPVVANIRKAGGVLLGRTNSPTFALRWFTSNLVHGHTRNPRNRSLTPGGSSGGAAAAVAAGIGPLAVGTDIGGSVRYPAYACGVHGIRPSLGRVPAFNASSPERAIGAQLMSAAGPIARTIDDLSLALRAFSAPDPRDPWHVAVPFDGREVPKRAALCLRPRGLEVVPEVEAALRDAARRLVDAGWTVDEIDDTPPMREAALLQEQLWLGDGFDALANAAEQDGDPGAAAVIAAVRGKVRDLPADVISRALVRRTTLTREWRLFLDECPVLLLPVSAELPFPDELDRQGPEGFDRVWEAQLTLRALPAMGLPGLAVTTSLVNGVPVGVQVVATHHREDLCLLAGRDIEARGAPVVPVDPVV
ncbi:amidase family protein [Burkholderia cenocepacia]|uniref:amidase family protein n=1 Tax=Burkholderia cepacia complex TaxID=87882 RepID=UPI000886A6FC|nr:MULTISPECIES: amidase family protein [Burkholderia cepacia complex]MBR8043080.1 amidase family protein [Burkholderia cenocepacia]MBR8325848.1 amidase family protein [Burkholderia cenocepacia]MDN7578585.1 amidase family protein [Burkholderia orbicola]MDN7579002.1 amidase family protein [Burkholderia orbicola]SDR47383.1 amidase [Burkholderia orbicola]